MAAVGHCGDLGPAAGWDKKTYHRCNLRPLRGSDLLVKFIARLQVGARYYSIRYSVKMALSVLKTILRYLGLDRDLRSAWVQPLAGRKRFIEIDLRKNNGQIYDIAARMPATDPVGTDRQMSSESVRPS